jgi:hypothetical protein
MAINAERGLVTGIAQLLRLRRRKPVRAHPVTPVIKCPDRLRGNSGIIGVAFGAEGLFP